MKTNQYSSTYVAILDLLFKVKSDKQPIYKIIQNGGRFERVKTTEESDRLNQDFYVAASELWSQCTPHEWYLIGRVSSELKKYNALWYCDPELKVSSANKKAIAGLIRLQVLFKTETTNIYLVNPMYARRGDFFSVLNTTASILMNSSCVTTDHIRSCNPIRQLDNSYHMLGQGGQQQ